LTGGLTAGSAVHTRSDTLEFVSLMSDNARSFCASLAAYLALRVGMPVALADEPWQDAERRLYEGDAHLGIVCGLQYVLSADREDVPGVELLAAPVMRAMRYGDRPMYFSDVVVREDSPAASLEDLRGAVWAFNEPTSHSGYTITRFVLASRGEGAAFFERVIASGSHLASLHLLLTAAIDATAIDSTVLEQELRERPWLGARIRVVETLGPSPIPPLVVSRGVSSGLREDLRAAVLAMHLDPEGRAVLQAGAVSRFVAVTDADYAPIREMLRIAERLEAWPLRAFQGKK
jgi:phosphonate transport system substrate-binding protein